MLRLQPSEIALTHGEVDEFKLRIDARRWRQRAHAHGRHLKVIKGPARSLVTSVNTSRHPFAHSVASSDFTLDSAVSDSDDSSFIAATTQLVVDEMRAFCGVSEAGPRDMPARPGTPDESSRLEQADFDEAADILDVRNIGLHVELVPNAEGYLTSSPVKSQPAPLGAHEPASASHSQNWEVFDESADEPSTDEATTARPQYPSLQAPLLHHLRPRSFSDPSGSFGPALHSSESRRLLQSYRRRRQQRNSSAASRPPTLHQDSQSQSDTGSSSDPQSLASDTTALHHHDPSTDGPHDPRGPLGPPPAIFHALRDESSPLDRLVQRTQSWVISTDDPFSDELPRRRNGGLGTGRLTSPAVTSLRGPPASPIRPPSSPAHHAGDQGVNSPDSTPRATGHMAVRPTSLAARSRDDPGPVHSGLGNEPFESSPVNHRIPRRPVPDRDGQATVFGPGPAPAYLGDAEHTTHVENFIEAQRPRFYEHLARTHGGDLPRDAADRWQQFVRHLASISGSDTDEAYHARQPSSQRETTSAHGRRRVEFAVVRGGRPYAESAYRAPVQLSRSNRRHFPQPTSEQENVGSSEEVFRPQSTVQRARRLTTSGELGDDERDDETPPRDGRNRPAT